MENEEIIKKIIKVDFEMVQPDDQLLENIQRRIENLPKKEIQPLLTKRKWINLSLALTFVFITLVFIEFNLFIQFDLPAVTKKIGLFLTELKLPLIGFTAVISIILIDRFFWKTYFQY